MLLALRRRLTGAVLTAFLGGFVVAPCLHTAVHADDHEHGPDGFSIQWRRGASGPAEASAEGRAYAHALAHLHGRAHPHAQPRGEAPAPLEPGAGPRADASLTGRAAQADDGAGVPPTHSHGAAAGHFGVATIAVAVFLPPVPVFACVAVAPCALAAEPPRRPSFDIAHPRGPPGSLETLVPV
jgi:hypothetical protein